MEFDYSFSYIISRLQTLGAELHQASGKPNDCVLEDIVHRWSPYSQHEDLVSIGITSTPRS